MKTIGVKIAEPVITSIGSIENTVWRIKSHESLGIETILGVDYYAFNVICAVYESRAKMDSGSYPLGTNYINVRRKIFVATSVDELTETNWHQALQIELEKDYTATEETA